MKLHDSQDYDSVQMSVVEMSPGSKRGDRR
jgi:hypothetical protein